MRNTHFLLQLVSFQYFECFLTAFKKKKLCFFDIINKRTFFVFFLNQKGNFSLELKHITFDNHFNDIQKNKPQNVNKKKKSPSIFSSSKNIFFHFGTICQSSYPLSVCYYESDFLFQTDFGLIFFPSLHHFSVD